jgi:hypothetical protein
LSNEQLGYGSPRAIAVFKMLKVRRSEDMGRTIFALSGRIQEEHLPELRELFRADVPLADTTLDLAEVGLVDREAIEFLAVSESRGVELRNCPSYVRVWIDTRRDVEHDA